MGYIVASQSGTTKTVNYEIYVDSGATWWNIDFDDTNGTHYAQIRYGTSGVSTTGTVTCTGYGTCTLTLYYNLNGVGYTRTATVTLSAPTVTLHTVRYLDGTSEGHDYATYTVTVGSTIYVANYKPATPSGYTYKYCKYNNAQVTSVTVPSSDFWLDYFFVRPTYDFYRYRGYGGSEYYYDDFSFHEGDVYNPLSHIPAAPSGYQYDHTEFYGETISPYTVTGPITLPDEDCGVTYYYSPTSNAYIWNGSSWVQAVPYIFNGTSWVQATSYIYNGSSWQS